MLTEELGQRQLAGLDTKGFRLWYFNFNLIDPLAVSGPRLKLNSTRLKPMVSSDFVYSVVGLS